MLVCGGFALGSTSLGGSAIQFCDYCTPNLIVTKAQGLGYIDTNIDYNGLKMRRQYG